jgi:alkanesulfonate monooxygenase SsuD/methylene tetrahydromethanopterin reductase-like flavin-dependent oxidoreductase (luciferase family)
MISAATSSHKESDRRTAAPRVGCVFRPQLPPEDLASVAHAADAAGLHELWLWEDCFAEGGMTTAAIALANSQTLTVGVGVLPAPLRNVALTAMEIACLERAFPGRVRIGVGHGVQDWMRQVGAHVSSPMTLLREYFTCLRALLRGDTVTFEGKYVSLTNVCLQWPPSGAVELLAAATGPKTLSLSGELATGTVLTGGTSPEGVRQALTHIEFGMAAGGVSSPHSVVVYVVCATGPDALSDATAEVRRWGFDESQPVSVFGDATEIAEAARQWSDAGATSVVMQPAADVDIHDFVGFIGSQVQPLLAR